MERLWLLCMNHTFLANVGEAQLVAFFINQTMSMTLKKNTIQQAVLS